MTRKRWRTVDREPVDVLTVTRISGKRSLTPEGYLLCEAVPLARTGEMVYTEEELPLKAGPDGLIYVTRDAEALFAPEALASYNGKSIVVDHPDGENVDPKNWRKYTVGVALNPRRGEGDDSDVVLVDLLIQDEDAIKEVQKNGRVEVSAGYEADYDQTGVGAARQVNIIGNHVALVERGRCGPRCAIGDHQPKENIEMPAPTPKSRKVILADSIRKVFADAGDQILGALESSSVDENEGGPGGADSHTHIHIHNGGERDGPAGGDALAGADQTNTTDETAGAGGDPLETRLTALESSVAQIIDMLSGQQGGADNSGGTTADDDGTMGQNEGGDEVTAQDGMPEEVEAAKGIKTGDSLALETSWRAVLADAEVLAPGYRLPTFDAKAKRKVTMDSMCALRRGILTHMMMTQDGATFLKAVNQTAPDIGSLTCAAAASLFRTAAASRRLVNNSVATADSQRVANISTPAAYNPSGKMTLAQLNALHSKHYAKPR